MKTSKATSVMAAVLIGVSVGGNAVIRAADSPAADGDKSSQTTSVAAPAPANDLMKKYPDTGGWSPDALECERGMSNVAQAAVMYGWKQGQLPADLGQTLRHIDRWSQQSAKDMRHATEAEKAAFYVCPADRKTVKLAVPPTPAWVNANTSYVYLGANAVMSKIPSEKWGTTVVVHDKVDGRHPEMGDLIIVVFLDGHRECYPRAQALAAIAESKKIFAAAQPQDGQ